MNHEDFACDVLVVGSGAAGLSTAVCASLFGLDVCLIEKESLLGGSTAYSYGTLWVPCNPVAAREGLRDDPVAALGYLQREMGAHFDAQRARAYIEHAPRMVDFFERHTDVRFRCRDDFPDHHPELPGASQGGRTLYIESFDGRQLGPLIDKLRPPLATQTMLGMMYSPKEVKLLQNATRTWRGARHTARRLLRHGLDLALHGRTLTLTNGNALVARLLKTATGLGVPIWTGAALQSLRVQAGAVTGATVDHQGRRLTIATRRGVVLACGGFGWDAALCAQWLDRPALDGANWSLATQGNTGDGLRAAIAAGAQVDTDLITRAFWAPVSRPAGGRAALAGHFHDRHRPGFLAVNAEGRRFANESGSNHHFAEAIVRAARPGTPPLAWLICDHRSLRRTGCGDLIAPWPARLRPHLQSGYLVRGATLGELAQRIGLAPEALQRTVDEFNVEARRGNDPQFGKGRSAFDRYYGDRRQQPNPCVGPLDHGPFYAVRVTAGHMGTLAGLKTDLAARVLDPRQRAIPGLYAVGNDMANVFGGACPGGGITLGPGMTFAFLASHHLAGGRVDDLHPDAARDTALAAA